MIETAAAALVQIVSANSAGLTHYGSGTAVQTEHGIRIVTALHIFERVDSAITVRVRRKRRWLECPGRVIAHSSHHDLAVLALDGELPMSPVPLGTSVQAYEDVFIAGCPFEHFGIITNGRVQAQPGGTGYPGFQNKLVFSGTIANGSSGGGIIDSDGTLVGVVLGALQCLPRDLETLGYAATIHQVRRLLRGV